MSKVHINVRVDGRILEAVDGIAAGEGTSRSAAVDKVLSIGLQQLEEQEKHPGGGGSRETIEAMRARIEEQSAQMAIKDGQIAQYGQLLEQAQKVQERIATALPVGQEQPQEGRA